MNLDEDAHTTTKDILMPSNWGSIFGEDDGIMNTLFSSLVDEYSSLVVADLDSLAGTTERCYCIFQLFP